MTTLPLAEVRANLSKLIEEAVRTYERIEVTRQGRRTAVILSAEDYDSIMETLAILSDQELMRDVRAAEAEAETVEIYRSTRSLTRWRRRAAPAMSYGIALTKAAKRALTESLPEPVAIAGWEFIRGPLAENPHPRRQATSRINLRTDTQHGEANFA